jgi:transcription elongation factor GreA
MENELIYLTHNEWQKLGQDLDFLRSEKRKEVADRLREAIADGLDPDIDLVYENVKSDQGFLEWRIREIEKLLSHPIIVNLDEPDTGTVRIGSTVNLQEDTLPPERYTIVGITEAEPSLGRISYRSPVGKGLIGSRPGDERVVATPSGDRRLRILSVS